MDVAGKSITAPYLLVINIPLFCDSEGRWWGDRLWVKDLHMHLEGIAALQLLCPRAIEAESGWLQVDTTRISIVAVMPPGRSWWWRCFSLYRQVAKAVADARIVHCGVAGWPFPLGWLACLAGLRRKRFLMIVVESSFWRVPRGAKASMRRRFHGFIYERLARAFARRANLLVVTQPEYRSLAGPRASQAFLNPATWVDEEFVLTDQAAAAAWQAKAPRLLYAGRLTQDKGVGVLLEAIRLLGGLTPQVDIVGEGDLLPECQALAAEMGEVVRVLQPVTYGGRFFEMLDDYCAVIVPIRSDEQPRIIFDAYARALPVFGSDAVGVASCVVEGETGYLHRTGSAESLSNSLRQGTASLQNLQAMGLNALQIARVSTHRNMHRSRIDRIHEAMKERPAG